MAVAKRLPVLVETSLVGLSDIVRNDLREEHGVYGVDVYNSSDEAEIDPALEIAPGSTPDTATFCFTDLAGEPQSIETRVKDKDSIREALSIFVMSHLVLRDDAQSSREDVRLLQAHRGARPAIAEDPSEWLSTNPFYSELARRHPSYGNLIRYLCNERGLFLKVGNYPSQRAYWNSTTNGGLPVYKKADPIHEGTFMLHDLFHLVPVDPLIGAGVLDDSSRAKYLAHRLISEATTLVMADMVGIADAPSLHRGYDIEKRRIYPIYDSIVRNSGKKPSVEKLLAANVYFCFTGETAGFELLGASPQVLEEYKSKYVQIFQDDFMWNLGNYDYMKNERDVNPSMSEYYEWIEGSTSVPVLGPPDDHVEGDGLDLNVMLSQFRAQYITALNYPNSIDDFQRTKRASEKYLAGQRVIFARHAEIISSEDSLSIFDELFKNVLESGNQEEVVDVTRRACTLVDQRVDLLQNNGLLLPHEAAMYKFTAPLYPVKFVNYERRRSGMKEELSDEISAFIDLNTASLRRLLDIVSS